MLVIFLSCVFKDRFRRNVIARDVFKVLLMISVSFVFHFTVSQSQSFDKYW